MILVLDVSGSMQAEDVKPTRLAAAQRAIHTFLDKVPGNVRVGLVLFAGTPIVATPPTTDHDLVGRAVDSAGDVNPFGGTAIGDALAAAVRLGRQVAGTAGGQQALGGARTLAAESGIATTHAPVSILFLSDGHQNRGDLQPLQGAARAKAAGLPGLHGRARDDRQHDAARPPHQRRLLLRRQQRRLRQRPGARPEDAARDRAPDRRRVLPGQDRR